MNSKRSWYLIYTKTRQEQVAELNLQRQDYQVFLPMISVRRRRAAVYHLVKEPMFPRYLFIALSAESDNWGPIRSTRGVAGLVRFGGIPARVPDALIHMLRHQTQSDDLDIEATPQFKSGESVRVLDGVLAGYEGIFESKTGSGRASVLLDLADRFTRVQIDLDQLGAV